MRLSQASICVYASILTIVCVIAQNAPFYRKDYVYSSDHESFYKVHNIRRSWVDAKRRCQREGARFFYPDSQQEASAVVELMKQKIPNDHWAWVGGTDITSEGDFETVDGKPIDETYSNWDDGEPNDRDGHEDCLIMRTTAKMNDDNCANKYPFVCKKTRASVTWNAQCEMPDPEYLYNAELGKCYKFHLKPLNWTEANSVCIAEQSYLAVINSQKEADFLVKLTNEAPKDRYKGYYLSGAVLLGFHNQFGEGYHTVNGVPLEESGYIKWGGGQPDGKEKEFCGSMFYNGGLNDMHCGSICYYICEHDIGELASSLDERFGQR